jgi:hypothetical protein
MLLKLIVQIIGRNSLSPLSYAQDSSLLEDASLNGGWQSARLQLPPVWVDLVDKVKKRAHGFCVTFDTVSVCTR